MTVYDIQINHRLNSFAFLLAQSSQVTFIFQYCIVNVLFKALYNTDFCSIQSQLRKLETESKSRLITILKQWCIYMELAIQ